MDGREAVPVELIKKFPPSLLRKRRRTGRYKYCLRELNGARAKVDDTDPVSVPAMRRRINGRRRILKSSSMMEDQPDRPARKMVVVELDGSHDVGQKRLAKQGTILYFLTKIHGAETNDDGSGGGGNQRVGGGMDPKNGSVETTQNGRLGNSVNLKRKKMVGGPKSKTGKGLMKKLGGGGSDSSQPGIKKFLMEIKSFQEMGIPLGIKTPIKPSN